MGILSFAEVRAAHATIVVQVDLGHLMRVRREIRACDGAELARIVSSQRDPRVSIHIRCASEQAPVLAHRLQACVRRGEIGCLSMLVRHGAMA